MWAEFSNRMIITLLHSFWQAAGLLLIYLFINQVYTYRHSLFNRNVLLLLLVAQILLSVLTFTLTPYTNFSEYSNITSYRLSGYQLTGPACSVAAMLYILIMLYKTIGHIWRWHRYRQMLTGSYMKPPAEIRIFAQLKMHELGIRRKVQIWLSDKVHSPVTFGFLKPVILLPISLLTQLNNSQIEALILHELSHIRRYDYLLNWIMVITENIFFFNPFVKLIIKYARLEREKACDSQVLDYRYPSPLYAEALLKIALMAQQPATFELKAFTEKNQLLQRITFFTGSANNKPRPNLTRFLIALLLFTGLATLSFFSLTLNTVKQNFTKADQSTKPISVNIQNERMVPVGENHSRSLPPGIRVMVIPETPEANLKTKQLNSSIDATASGQTIITDTEVYNSVGAEAVIPALQASTANLQDTKEFFIREEDPAKRTIITRAFRMNWDGSLWIPQFLWMTTETRPETDSLNKTPVTSPDLKLQ